MDNSEPLIDDFLPLRPKRFHLLAALAGGEKHGYAIMQEVAGRSGGKVRLWPAMLYRSIRSLAQEGLIERAQAPPPESGDDPRRRYYRLSGLGRRVLLAEARRLKAAAELVLAQGDAE